MKTGLLASRRAFLNTFSFLQAPSGLPVSQTRHRKLGSPAKSSGPFLGPKTRSKNGVFQTGPLQCKIPAVAFVRFNTASDTASSAIQRCAAKITGCNRWFFCMRTQLAELAAILLSAEQTKSRKASASAKQANWRKAFPFQRNFSEANCAHRMPALGEQILKRAEPRQTLQLMERRAKMQPLHAFSS